MAGMWPAISIHDTRLIILHQKFSNERPHDERVQISQNAINELMGHLNADNGEFDGSSSI
jgi:hypothetical protein